MSLIKNNFPILLVVFYFIGVSTSFSQLDSGDFNNLEIKKILSNDEEYCAVPLDFQLSFSEKVDRVYNVQNVKGGINISSNESVVINTGVVYLNGNPSEAFYSPEKCETQISKEFQKLLNTKLDSTLSRLDDLNKKITSWDSKIIRFAAMVDKLPEQDPKKAKGINLIRQYKKNIQTASCLNDDYADEVIIKTDTHGNRDFLFDLEKIKNDPNYFFVGRESEGYSVTKKFNKFGYLNLDNSNNNIPFKYEHASDFKNGYAHVQDSHFHYIINNEGIDVLSFSKQNTESLTILENGIFIKHGTGKAFDRSSYFVDHKGEILSEKFDEIGLHDFENVFEVTLAVRNNPKNLSAGGIYSYQSHTKYFDNRGKEINLTKRDLKTLNKKYYLNEGQSFRYKQILFLPDRKHTLFVFKVDNSENSYLILKNLNINEIISHSKVTKVDYFFKIKNISENNTSYNHDILYYKFDLNDSRYSDSSFDNDSLIYYDSEQVKKLSIINNPQIKESVAESHKELGIYYLKEQKDITLTCNKVEGIFADKKLILFSKYLGVKPKLKEDTILAKTIINPQEDKSDLKKILPPNIILGQGILNLDGQIVIPPLFKEIVFIEEKGCFQLLDYYENSYLVNLGWNCIDGNCNNYKQLIREYYPLIGKN